VLSSVGPKTRIDLLLVTGKDAAIAAQFHAGHPELSGALLRLRQGSRGEAVERLQAKLDVEATGFFGPATRKALTELQHEVNERHGLGKTADGIYSPEFDRRVGWNVFEPLIS
jgi:peptidoglycan hydrolase-like protein with peptidoglycan-binding domain